MGDISPEERAFVTFVVAMWLFIGFMAAGIMGEMATGRRNPGARARVILPPMFVMGLVSYLIARTLT